MLPNETYHISNLFDMSPSFNFQWSGIINVMEKMFYFQVIIKVYCVRRWKLVGGTLLFFSDSFHNEFLQKLV